MASVFSLIAIAIHFYIFYLELPAFGSKKFQETFKTKSEEHDTLRAPFNNLAVYNGSIGLMTLIGLVCTFFDSPLPHIGGLWVAGVPYGFLTGGLSIMAIAGIYLFLTSPDKRRAACIQALPPLLALCFWLAI